MFWFLLKRVKSLTFCRINNNNNNNRIYIAPYGRNFRGAGGRSDQCAVEARVNNDVLSMDLKADSRLSELFVAASSRQTVLKIGNHAWKSLSWWTVGPAAGWQMNVKFGFRHVPWFDVAYVPGYRFVQQCI